MNAGINPVRGDVEIVLSGRARRLRLTFGALAEIEGVLGAQGLAEMGARIRVMTSQELVQVLAALLRGGGEDISTEEVERAQVHLGDVAKAVAAIFQRALT